MLIKNIYIQLNKRIVIQSITSLQGILIIGYQTSLWVIIYEERYTSLQREGISSWQRNDHIRGIVEKDEDLLVNI